MKLSHAFSYVPKSPLSVLFGLIAAFTLSVGAFAAFGPDRPTYTWDGNDTEGADHVTFNSFVNNPVWGDERDFARGVVAGRDSNWTDPLQNVEDGHTVNVIMFVHNNADASLNASGEGIARDTRIAVDIPTTSAEGHDITGTISASNAKPGSVYDTLSLSSAAGHFELDYVEGSAHIVGNHIDQALSDDLVSGGVLLGDALDGNMKGCFDSAVYVTFEVEVKQPRYKIDKTVRVLNSGASFGETANLDKGDIAEWEIRFENAGSTDLNNVAVVDEVPAGLTVKPGSIELINTSYPDGVAIPDDAIQANGRQLNVAIGGYGPGGAAYLYFETTVNELDCEVTKKFVNKAFATPEGYGAIWDVAEVTATGDECDEPEEKFSYDCDALNVSIIDKANRTVRAEAIVSHSDNVTVVGTEIDFGGGNVSTDNPAEFSYATIGEKTITATVAFELDNESKEVKEATCSNSIEFGEVEGEVTEPELPNTGAGAVMFTLFGTTSAAAAAYGYIQNRRTV